MTRAEPLRVLLIDDAVLFRQALAAELDRCADLHACACGSAIEDIRPRLLQFHPEVILLDLDVQGCAALDLLRKLREHYPVPVLVCARGEPQATLRAIKAIERGAVEAVQKPRDTHRASLAAFARELAAKAAAAAAHVRPVAAARVPGRVRLSTRAVGVDPGAYLVVVGASTGGTQAIAALLERVPADFPPVAIVQHMPPGFTRSFANRLNSLSALRVTEAEDGEVLGPGRAVVARGDTHLVVRNATPPWRVGYTHTQLVNRHCPSVDVLFESAVRVGRRAVGILLTGMGADGARGLLALRRAGAFTLAQDEASCVVYGMPKEAVELGAVMRSLPPHEMPGQVVQMLQRRPATATSR